MKHVNSSREQRTWIEEAQYYLFRNNGVSFTFFLHQAIVNMSNDINKVGSIASVYMRSDGAYVLQFHWPSVKVLDIPAACELLKHEIMHVVLGHTGSRGEAMVRRYGKDITGIAVDLAVNQHVDISQLARFGWPGVCIADFKFPENMTAPWYCEALVKKIKEQPKKEKPQSGNGGAGAEGDSNSDGEGQEGESGEIPKDGAGKGKGKGRPIEVPEWLADQLAQAGKPVPAKPKDFPAEGGEFSKAIKPGGSWDEIFGGPPEGEEGLTGEMRDIHAEKLITKITNEANKRELSMSRGWACGEATEWIEQVQRGSKTPWYTLIRRLESKHVRVNRELTKKRPSRRHPDHFGRLRKQGLYCWFVVDTSGSMGHAQLALVDPEVRGISRRGAVIDIVHCDAAVSKVERYTNSTKVRQFHGRGGTDFSPVFQLLRETDKRDQPKFVIYITDGYGGLEAYRALVDSEEGDGAYTTACDAKPEKCPEGIDVLWLIPEGCMKVEDFQNRVAEFGKVISIPEVEGSGTKEAK